MSGFAWLTPAGPSALALVRIDGVPPQLLDRAAPEPGRARFARLLDPSGTAVDEVVAWRLDDGALELSLHGGPGVRAAVDRCLRAHGLTAQEPRVTATWAALAAAPSPAAVRWLLAHGAADPPFPRRFLAQVPVVLIVGAANAGKSTLLNAWCGRRRAIVADLPGTTRDLLAAETLARGWRLRLLDSAGLRATEDPIERAGQRLVEAARARADLVLRLLAPGDPPALAGELAVLGKADLRPDGEADEAVRWSSVGVRGADPATLLARLADAVLARLGLPAAVAEDAPPASAGGA